MNWILVFISGLITYFLRYSMISLIKKDMLSEKTKILLGYVPSAVFPALIFPAVLLENSGSFVNYNDTVKFYALVCSTSHSGGNQVDGLPSVPVDKILLK